MASPTLATLPEPLGQGEPVGTLRQASGKKCQDTALKRYNVPGYVLANPDPAKVSFAS